jgi:hypothetical protein
MPPKSQRDLEHDLNARIDALHYEFDRFEVGHYIQHLEKLLSRRIEVHAFPLPHTIYGLCVDWKSAFYILINRRLHPMQQTHTLLHETAHLLLNHTNRSLTGELPEALTTLFDGAAPRGHVRSVAGLMANDDEDELEAELFVMLFRRRLMQARRLHELYGAPTSIEPYSEQFYALGFNEGNQK